MVPVKEPSSFDHDIPSSHERHALLLRLTVTALLRHTASSQTVQPVRLHVLASFALQLGETISSCTGARFQSPLMPSDFQTYYDFC